MNSTRLSTPFGNVRTRPTNSRRRKTGQQPGFKQSPQTFSRGTFSRSRSSVRRPALAQKAAQLDPAGPPPAIATSNMRDYLPSDRNEQGIFRARGSDVISLRENPWLRPQTKNP